MEPEALEVRDGRRDGHGRGDADGRRRGRKRAALDIEGVAPGRVENEAGERCHARAGHHRRGTAQDSTGGAAHNRDHDVLVVGRVDGGAAILGRDRQAEGLAGGNGVGCGGSGHDQLRGGRRCGDGERDVKGLV